MPVTAPHAFFQEPRSFMELKQELLLKAFEAWCSFRMATGAVGPENPLLFADLNAAAGQYLPEQQQVLLPLFQHLLRSTLKQQGLSQHIRFYIGDPAKIRAEDMDQDLKSLTAYEALATPPALLQEAESKAQLEEELAAGFPSLLFLDPFSYGYAQETLLKACTTRKSDLFLLLTPDSIRKALTGKKVSQPLTALLGERLTKISAFSRREKDKARRAEYVLQHLHSLLLERGLYTLLFRVNAPGTAIASQYVLFSSPDAAAYTCIKEVLLPYSEYQPDGIPLFIANQGPQHQLSLFPHRPKFTLAHLTEALAATAIEHKFKTIEKIYTLHSPNTPYIRENYLSAFEQLRDEGKVELLNGKTMQTIRKATFTSVVKFLA